MAGDFAFSNLSKNKMDDIGKIIATLAGILALYKIFVDLILSRSHKRREEYNFTKQFISDLNDESVHKYIKEKGIFALTGKYYSIIEMRKLLNYPCPSEAIEHLSSSGKCIKFNCIKNEFDWNGIYSNIKGRTLFKYIYLILYVCFSSIGLFPLTLKGFGVLNNFSLSLIIFSFMILSFFCLSKHENMKEAISFMKINDDKY